MASSVALKYGNSTHGSTLVTRTATTVAGGRVTLPIATPNTTAAASNPSARVKNKLGDKK
jgi:hypothetical protein